MSQHFITGFRLAPQLDAEGHEADFRLLRRLPRISEISVSERADNPIVLGIVDTETTSLDPQSGELIEIAITIMEINIDGRLAWLHQPRCWLEQPTFPLEPRIEQITGLNDTHLAGMQFDEEAIAEQVERCHLLVSHNARFDRAFLARRFGSLLDMPWACTAAEMDWLSHGFGGRSLGHLMYEAGYFYDAHRAGPDCWALACLLVGEAGDGRCYAAHLIDAARQPSYRIHASRAPLLSKTG